MLPEIATISVGCVHAGARNHPTTDFLSVVAILSVVASLAPVASCASRVRISDVSGSGLEESGVVPEVREPDIEPCNVPREEFTEIRSCTSNEECPTGWCLAVVGAIDKEGVCALQTEQCPPGWVPRDMYMEWGEPYNFCLKPHCVPELVPADMICGSCGWSGCRIELQSLETYPHVFGQAEGVCVVMEEPRQYCSIPCDEGSPCPQGSECAELWVSSEQQYGYHCKPAEPCEAEAGLAGVSCSKNEECYSGYCVDDPTSEEDGAYCAGHCSEAFDCGPPDGDYMCVCVGMWCPVESPWLCVLKAGWPCSFDGECAKGFVCHDEYEKPECRPPSGKGEPCLYSDDCEDSLYCDPAGETPVCRPGERGAYGLPCKKDIECQPGLICNLSSIPGLCLPPL